MNGNSLFLEQMNDALCHLHERIAGHKVDFLAISSGDGLWGYFLDGCHLSTGRGQEAVAIFLTARQNRFVRVVLHHDLVRLPLSSEVLGHGRRSSPCVIHVRVSSCKCD